MCVFILTKLWSVLGLLWCLPTGVTHGRLTVNILIVHIGWHLEGVGRWSHATATWHSKSKKCGHKLNKRLMNKVVMDAMRVHGFRDVWQLKGPPVTHLVSNWPLTSSVCEVNC